MAVEVFSVKENSISEKHGIEKGDTLLSINGKEIVDVLDYRFYASAKRLHVRFLKKSGEEISFIAKSNGDPDALGVEGETYLMDKVRTCRNNCIFCFVDQMPEHMRDTLYFKDDDFRLSFIFGNYITLTNLTEHDIDRILEMHIEPINISVHTMNRELRVKMMRNRFAGDVLDYMQVFADGNIDMNIQFVLCPGINDGKELEYSLNELLKYGDSIKSVAAVPVGLTDHREGLSDVRPYTKDEAAAVIDLCDDFNRRHFDEYGRCFVCAADEFYLKADRKIPNESYYSDFPQLSNGVGMMALMRKEFYESVDGCDSALSGNILLITGYAAYELLCDCARYAEKKFAGLTLDVKKIRNDYFGEKITVAGLLTGTDIAAQSGMLSDYDGVVIPSVMLKSDDERVFLDDMTLEELEKKIQNKITVTDGSGNGLFGCVEKICGARQEAECP